MHPGQGQCDRSSLAFTQRCGGTAFPGPAKPFPCCQDGRQQDFLGLVRDQPWSVSALLVCSFTFHGRPQEMHAELQSPRVGQTGRIHLAAPLQGHHPRLVSRDLTHSCSTTCCTWDSPGDGKASAVSVIPTLNNNRLIVKKTLKGWLFSVMEKQEKKIVRVCPIHLSLRK